MTDPFKLRRFVEAQNPVYEQVCRELRAGNKTGHWMWFVFPQMQGLGHSAMATKFAISCRREAEAYLQHPILGSRLVECTRLVNSVEGLWAREIFGTPDDLKFRSSMTLFATVDPQNPDFDYSLQKYFGGNPDPLTVEWLSTAARHHT